MKMNRTRLVLGAILPVPLYCLGSTFYAFPSPLRYPVEFATLAILWLGYGALIMGIPSMLYSLAIEALHTKANASLAFRSIGGAILGFLSGSLCFLLNTEPSVFYTMSLPGAAIGGIIPVILAISKKSEQDVHGNTH
jgi:MFS family permease